MIKTQNLRPHCSSNSNQGQGFLQRLPAGGYAAFDFGCIARIDFGAIEGI